MILIILLIIILPVLVQYKSFPFYRFYTEIEPNIKRKGGDAKEKAEKKKKGASNK